MRNLLEEFHYDHGIHPPTILGVREHVFTGRYVFVEQCLYFEYFFSMCIDLTLCAVFLLWLPLCQIRKLAL